MSTEITNTLDGHHSKMPFSAAQAILMVVAIYLVSLLFQLPQQGTEMVVAANAQHDASKSTEHEHADSEHDSHSEGDSHSEHDAHGTAGDPPPFWTVVPFLLLLGAIAILPLISKTEHWWESNLNRFKVAASLGGMTLAYYAFFHHASIDAHWPAHHIAEASDGFFQLGFIQTILGNAVMQEFIPFIVLLFSLYTICGGVRIEGDLQANPMTNASFMAIGGLLASFIGTTGAAMLLIRPLLETNSERRHVVHTIVFFIFVVCNCGGCLLPIGDPPLFLGYLQGVPFTWTLCLTTPWIFVNGLLLLTYLVLDEFVFYRKETVADIRRDVTHVRRLRFSGLMLNIPLLFGVVMAVALLDPSKTIPGTNWHPWMYLREIVQISLVATSLILGSKKIREANLFNYHAIIEVAALFIGIFVCMQPALQILGVYGNQLGIETPMHFYWITGGLSSVLDNAPTYLVFFKTAQTMAPDGATGLVAGVDPAALKAISASAVFMGAMTYIGNGPNFMVKAIAEKSGVKMPSFFGYMAYSCMFLLPILALYAWQFM